MKPLSLIIISYNRPADTLDLLQDISNLSHINLLEDVIILNNDSTEDYTKVTEFIQEKTNIPFKFVDSIENLGVSRGRNYASKYANGEIFVYLDDDVNIKDKDILNKIFQSFSKAGYNGRQLGVVCFKILYSSTLQMQVNAFPHKKFEKYKDKKEFLTYYYSGCAHAKLKQAWIETGNYPENFFYGMEEYDFSYRLLDKDYCIKYDSSVVIYHKESPFGRKTKSQKLKMMWVNKTKIAWRYLPKKYFYSTAILWSFEYLKKSGFGIKNFLAAWKEIFLIPKNEKRNPIKDDTLNYLKAVEARLWY